MGSNGGLVLVSAMFHVLVIEERWRIRELLVRVLSDAGYTVSEADDGRTALELARKRPPDVMVHGRVTVGSSEILAARTADPRLSGVALIMTSVSPEFFEGADVYLSERFTLDDLLAALARCEERAPARVRRTSPGGDLGVDIASRR